MARPLRIQYPGAFYHITSRGNERKAIFRTDQDRKKFLSYLQSAHERYGAVLHVYCLMGNHYHLLLETPRANLSEILHHINGAYTTYFNLKTHRSGHLFQGRYRAILVEKDAYCQELSRYIHLNPLRAGIVRDLRSYRWSSYPQYVGLSQGCSWLETGYILGYFDQHKRRAQTKYMIYVEEAVRREPKNPLESVFASTFLGSPAFVEEQKQRMGIGEKADTRNVPALKAFVDRPSLDRIRAEVGNHVDSTLSLSKKIGIYVSQRFGGYRLAEIGGHYEMTGAAVSQACRRFDERIREERILKALVGKITKGLGLLNVET
jgi:putative transposase